MSTLGNASLEVALLLSALAIAAGLVGKAKGHAALLDLQRRLLWAVAGLLTLSVLVLETLFFSNDFLVRLVQSSANVSLPWTFRVSLLWVDLESSILFWAWILSVVSAFAVHRYRHRLADLTPHAAAVLMFVLAFFLYLLLFQKNPFDEYLVESPLLGNGMRPLLRNPWMLVHPPAQYLGYIVTTVPFAYAVAALLRPAGALPDPDDWLRELRPFLIGAWLLLGLGLVLGMMWAYDLLDWGGWWSWDPIENASLFPWLTATALLHSAIATTRRRGLLRGWTIFLVLTTFWLTLFGTFLTRTGFVRSVHTFGEDKALLWAFLIFMGLGASTYGLFIARFFEGRARGRSATGFLSLEFLFVVVNWLFMALLLVVLAGTLYPTLHEAVTGGRVSMGPPFFEKTTAPLGLLLLLLIGLAPLLSFRPMRPRKLLDLAFWPLVALVVTALAIPLLIPSAFPARKTVQLFGHSFHWPGLSLVQLAIGLSAFAVAAAAQQVWRLASTRARIASISRWRALAHVFVRHNVRHAAYLVHVGTALMFLGFSGHPLVTHGDRVLDPGDTYRIAGIELAYQQLAFHRGIDAEAVQALFLKRAPGDAFGDPVAPTVLSYYDNPAMPVNQAALIRGLGRDLHVRLSDYRNQRVSIKVAVHPLVSWIWIGFLVTVLGGVWAMASGSLPRRTPPSRRPVRAPWLRWGIPAAGLVWLTAVALTLSHGIAEGAHAAWISLFLTGAATFAAGGLILWAFAEWLPPGRATPAAILPSPTPRVSRRDLLVQEVLQIEQDEALGKLTPEDARPAIAALRGKLAVLLATEQARATLEGSGGPSSETKPAPEAPSATPEEETP